MTRVWELGSGEVVHEYPPPAGSFRQGPVSALAFSTDSALLAAGSHLSCVNVHNMRKYGLSTANTSSAPLLSLNISPRTSSILHLQFTHRNCLVGIGKLDPGTYLDPMQSFAGFTQ